MAVLGFLWMFLNPLIQMVVMGLVFSLIFQIKIVDYYLFLLIGLLGWNFFSQSLNKATSSLVYERGLIQKSPFPKAVIPLSIVFSNFIHLLASLFLLLLFLRIAGKIQVFLLPNFSLLALGLLFLVAFTAGASLISSALNVFWRDIAFLVQSLILVWFYATPVLYPFSLIPQGIRPFFYLNPLAAIFSLLQGAVTETENFPSLVLYFQFLVTILLGVLGIAIFRSKEKSFGDWL